MTTILALILLWLLCNAVIFHWATVRRPSPSAPLIREHHRSF